MKAWTLCLFIGELVYDRNVRVIKAKKALSVRGSMMEICVTALFFSAPHPSESVTYFQCWKSPSVLTVAVERWAQNVCVSLGMCYMVGRLRLSRLRDSFLKAEVSERSVEIIPIFRRKSERENERDI